MGSRLGPRALERHVSLVPTLLRADSGTNLSKQGGGISNVDRVAR